MSSGFKLPAFFFRNSCASAGLSRSSRMFTVVTAALLEMSCTLEAISSSDLPRAFRNPTARVCAIFTSA